MLHEDARAATDSEEEEDDDYYLSEFSVVDEEEVDDNHHDVNYHGDGGDDVFERGDYDYDDGDGDELKMDDFEDEANRGEKCAICLGEIRGQPEEQQRIVKTECEHEFHESCISSWFVRNHSCPLCRSPNVTYCLG
ncbi:hypothetical protein Ancab_015802 [Ancistrocladus abbreviatus]